jgi:hypothetical protein
MKRSQFIIIILSVISFNCASNNAIDREIIPTETYESKIKDDRCILVLSRNFDISCEEIKLDKMENILKTGKFITTKNLYNLNQLSSLIIFKIVLENTGNDPIGTGEIKIKYENSAIFQLSGETIRKKLNNPGIDFNEFLSLYKLEAGDICENDIDFQRDIIKNTTSRINPGEKALFFTVFDWIPVQVRKFSLSVTIKSDITQKIIDFKLTRFEYRKSGKDFVKPEHDAD